MLNFHFYTHINLTLTVYIICDEVKLTRIVIDKFISNTTLEIFTHCTNNKNKFHIDAICTKMYNIDKYINIYIYILIIHVS